MFSEFVRSRAIIIAKGYFRSLIFFPSVRPFVRLAFWEKRSNCLLDENVLNKSYFKLTRDVAEHTLPTKNWPRPGRNSLCQPEIDPGHGGTPSSDRKLTRDVAEHTILTGNWPGTRRNTLCRPEIYQGRGGTHSADRKSTRDVAAPRRCIAPLDFMHGIYKRRALAPCDFLLSFQQF